jgi:hypothetical protein
VVEPDFVTTAIPEVVDALVIVYPFESIVPLPVTVKVMTTELESDTLAETLVGAFGLVVTTDDAIDAAEVPDAVVAVTVNVYGVLDVNPVIINDVVEPDFVTTEIPEVGDALVIVYPLVSIVPLGAVKVIVAEDESITLAETPVGAFVIVVTTDDAVDGKDIPPELVAVTVNV